MAKLTEAIVMAIGVQSAEGTVNTVVRDSTIIGTTEGGSTALGLLFELDTLTLDFERIEEAGQDVPGSFTKNRGFLLHPEVSEFSFSSVVKGSGQTLTTPAAGEYNLPLAVENVWAGAGIVRGTPTGSETPYALGAPSFLTIKVWRGNQSWVLVDCKVNELALELPPGELVRMTPTIVVGSIIHRPADTFPVSITYGLQESTTPPVLKNAGAQIGATVRGFLEGTLTVANEYEQFPDSNAAEGFSNEQTGRTITWEGNFYVDSGNINQDFLNLSQSVPPTEELIFQLGVNTTTPGAIANAIQFTLFNVNFTVQSVVQEARRIVYGLEGYATANAGAANSEFSFRSR